VENGWSSYKKTVAVAIGITVIGLILVISQYTHAAARSGTMVMPAGTNYLGPNDPNHPAQITPTSAPTVFTATTDTPWHDVKGNVYPYVISVPTTLTLVAPKSNNTYDIYAISWGGYDINSTVLIGVDNLSNNPNNKPYINQPKTVYINNWWKQFNGLTGVSGITPFTNSNGLKGYTVKFLNTAGQSPNTDVFFEVPGAPQYVIHLSNGILDPAVFTKIVDSVRWVKQ
jgi:hypothetical protein